MKWYLLVIGFLLFHPVTGAQETSRWAIEIVSKADDFVGQRLVYLLKEEIRRSSSMRLTYQDESRMQLNIITIDQDERNPGRQTVYAVTWTLKLKDEVLAYYISSCVGYSGTNRVAEVAQGLAADTDKHATELITLARTTR
jgi:hypothetical protein